MRGLTEVEIYRQTWLRRIETLTQAQRERSQRAWKVAQQAAQVLYQEFGVERVALFGSLLDEERFDYLSDIDLAVWGVTGKRYFQAVGQIQALSDEFTIDLVAFEQAPPSLQEVILEEGKAL